MTVSDWTPFFLPGQQGTLFAIYHAPVPPLRGQVLYLPPFAEEANKTRRMAALAARRLAGAGWGVLLLDGYGTGDSAGEFGQATWDGWRTDAGCAQDWLTERGGPLVLWGVRSGALLAVQTAQQVPPAALLLWQPVMDGERFLHQFLRLRLAAALGGGQRETTAQLRAQLAAGQTLAVAGYELNPELAAALAGLRLVDLLPPPAVPVQWLADAPATAGDEAVLAVWREQGVRVERQVVTADPFWQTQEIVVSEDWLAATVAALAGLPL